MHAESLQPYLSALNRVHEDLGFAKPAVGHLISEYKRGRGHEYAAAGLRRPRRVYLPATAVDAALEWALAFEFGPTSTWADFDMFRAACAVVFSFVFAYRGASHAGVRQSDVRPSAAGLTLSLEREKGKAARKWARSITLPPGAVAGLDELLEKWERVRGEASPSRPYFSYDFEDVPAAGWPASRLDDWLQLVLGRLDLQPPEGETWTGHSLRKGAASGMAAAGVAIHRICFVGGWSTNSGVVHDYIYPTCPDSAAGRRFFGWLLPTGC